jgi:hypothetical protein
MKWGRSKPAQDDEKTETIGSTRQASPEPEPTSEEVESAPEPVATERTMAVSQPASGDETSEKRRGPSPRIPWPARDTKFNLSETGARAAEPQSAHSAEARTQLYRPAQPAASQVEAGAPAARAAERDDPVVGWLVVMQGPGKGHSRELGIGSNSIGRDAGQKVVLDFGDDAIHRDKHALVVFDPRSNRFFLQNGNGARNLTYLGDELVLTPVELKGGETIVIGQTHLQFVPFCGPNFSWS